MKRANACLALIALTLAVPAGAAAVGVRAAPVPPLHHTVTYTYKSFLAPENFGTGAFGDLNQDFGSLKLTFNADGIISGTYKPDFGSFVSVTGGRNGNTFWLEFGSRGVRRFQGHFTIHGLVATASTFSPRGTYWRLVGQFVSM